MEDKILEAFSFGKIQECANIKAKLDEHNISWEEFLEWIPNMAKRLSPDPIPPKVPNPPNAVLRRICPQCEKHWLALWEVNTFPGNMVGEGFECMWYCSMCDFEEYSKTEVKLEAEPYIVYSTFPTTYIPVTGKDVRRERRLAAQKSSGGK
jgi:hypothetical protein